MNCSQITVLEHTDMKDDSKFVEKMISCLHGGTHIKEFKLISDHIVDKDKYEQMFEFISKFINLE